MPQVETVVPPISPYEEALVTRADTNPSTTSAARKGWNVGHHHNTRFKARLQANLTCLQPTPSPSDTMSHAHIKDRFQAMISHIEQLQCHEDGTQNFNYPCTFTTNSENDTLHYGDML